MINIDVASSTNYSILPHLPFDNEYIYFVSEDPKAKSCNIILTITYVIHNNSKKNQRIYAALVTMDDWRITHNNNNDRKVWNKREWEKQ